MPHIPLAPRAFTDLSEQRKNATVVSACLASRLTIGDTIDVRVTGGSAHMPCTVTGLHPAQRVGKVPSVAQQTGLALGDFTQAHTDWRSYLRGVSTTVRGSCAVLVLTPTGPVSGQRPSGKVAAPRKSPDSFHGKPWQRVTSATAKVVIGPDTQIHPADRDTVRDRLATAIRAAQPDRDTVRPLAAVTAAILDSGRCQATPSRKRKIAPDSVRVAHEWLHQQNLIELSGSEWVLASSLLEGLRVLPHPAHTPTKQ